MTKDRSDIEEIRRRVSIAEVVGEHVSLKRSGGNLKGLCPFHSEKTPSFTVNEQRGLYKCFGCGASGDIFRFLQEKNGVSFGEALRDLARRAGVTLSGTDGRENGLREAIIEINEKALGIYRDNLAGRDGVQARRYLAERGIDSPLAERFDLGLALPGFQNLHSKFSKAWNAETLEASGLFRRNQSGKWYDLFRDRIIFPIHDSSRRVVAFGGRLYRPDAEGPKYVNSPETPVYRKGHTIYGIHLARDAGKASGRFVLVEGYTDVMICHKHGFTDVVAALGTALTLDQVRMLSRFAGELLLAYDADAAGRKAAERGIDIALDQGLAVKMVDLPDNLDPADALLKHGPEAFDKALASARDFLEHRIDRALQVAKTPVQRAKAAREILASLSTVRDRLVRGAAVRAISTRFGISESDLLSEISPLIQKEAGALSVETGKAPRMDSELSLLKLLVDEKRFRAVAGSLLREEDFSKEPRRAVYRAILEAESGGEEVAGSIGGRLDGLSLDLMAHIATAPPQTGDSVKLFHDYVKVLKIKRIDDEINACTVDLRSESIPEARKVELSRRLSDLWTLKRTTLATERTEVR